MGNCFALCVVEMGVEMVGMEDQIAENRKVEALVCITSVTL